MKRKAIVIATTIVFATFVALLVCPGTLSFRRVHLIKSWVLLPKQSNQPDDWPDIFNRKDPEPPIGIGVVERIYGIRFGDFLLRVDWTIEYPPDGDHRI